MRHIRKEVEIKLRVTNRRATLHRLAQVGAKPAHDRVHEMNTLFDTPDGSLARSGQTVRIRVERPARVPVDRHAAQSEKPWELPHVRTSEVFTLTYKGPAAGHARPGRRQAPRYKVREEYEVRVSDARTLERLLQALGLRPWFRYEKYRSSFRIEGLVGVVVDLDETPVGDFLELEGKPAEIDRAAALLGYTSSDYIVRSYGGLYLESLKPAGRNKSQYEPRPESGVSDMLFPRRRSGRG